MAESNKTPELSKALQGKFEMVGYVPGKFRLKDGRTVDTTSMSLAQAEELVKNGFKYLKKIDKSEAAASGKSIGK